MNNNILITYSPAIISKRLRTVSDVEFRRRIGLGLQMFADNSRRAARLKRGG